MEKANLTTELKSLDVRTAKTLDTDTLSTFTTKSQMVASFNAKARMNPHTITAIKKDGELLVGEAFSCRD